MDSAGHWWNFAYTKNVNVSTNYKLCFIVLHSILHVTNFSYTTGVSSKCIGFNFMSCIMSSNTL